MDAWMNLCVCKEPEITTENIVRTTPFVRYNVISFHVTKPSATEEWTKEAVKERIYAYQEKSTSLEIIVLDSVHQFVRIMKSFAMELIQNNGLKDLAALRLTFVCRKELASSEILVLELAPLIVHQAKD